MPKLHAPSATGRVASAPFDTEEARSLLQLRLAQFGRLGMLTGLFFLAVAVVIALAVPIRGSRAAILAQVGSSTAGALLWLSMRRGTYRAQTLLVVDVLATLGMCGVFIHLGWGLPIWGRPDLAQLVCITDILALRAFLVPSTTRRTAFIGALASSMLMISTWFMYQGPKVHPDAPEAAGYVAVAGCLALGTIILTALTSKTIFGLRERVREAVRLGQYLLLEKIGEGGMGIVFKAQHAMLRRPTAIKLLPVERAGEHNLARFEREVQLTSSLTHPNTVSIYDYGRTADGVLYYAMEFLDGIDLEGLVELDGAQPPGRVVHLLRQIAGALEEAHSVGLIHRDVKPANVLLTTRSGSPDLAKVVDFGLVKSLDERTDVTATGSNQIVGTPLYMSPETIARPAEVDGRSDLYALGALGYFLLTGRPPFTGATAMEVCGHHLHSQPTAPHERLGREPLRLDSVILRCLEKSPDARPQHAAAVTRLLDECTDVLAWTAEHSRAWWAGHDRALRERRAARVHSQSTVERERTVAVNWRARAGAALAE
jgi:eukaryotic-like serine/threonine-protein kinase